MFRDIKEIFPVYERKNKEQVNIAFYRRNWTFAVTVEVKNIFDAVC